jgi:hypothetical protein
MKKKPVGRPLTASDSAEVVLDATSARTRIQVASERRAVVNFLINAGGRATIGEINAHFDYDLRTVLFALEKTGWVKVARTTT